jgi:hypothetical protein
LNYLILLSNLVIQEQIMSLLENHIVIVESNSLSAMTRAHSKFTGYGQYSSWTVGPVQESNGSFSFKVESAEGDEAFNNDSLLSNMAGDQVSVKRATPTSESSEIDQAKFAVANGKTVDEVLDTMIGNPAVKVEASLVSRFSSDVSGGASISKMTARNGNVLLHMSNGAVYEVAVVGRTD